MPLPQVTIVRSAVKNKLFIGNLPRELSKEELEALMNAEAKGMQQCATTSYGEQVMYPWCALCRCGVGGADERAGVNSQPWLWLCRVLQPRSSRSSTEESQQA